MLKPPTLLPVCAAGETFAGITYHVDGELVPVLSVNVGADQPVYFEHHIMLWKEPTVQIQIRPMKGALKRLVAGMQVFITEAVGQGEIAFSRDGAGHIFGIHLRHGEEIHVREHQFLAASKSIDYTFERIKGFATMMFGGAGIFVDKFRAADGDGIIWVHGYGNVFEKVLGPGEVIDIEPGGWLYKDPMVEMTTSVQSLSTGLFGSMNFITNRFRGPGRIGIQSMYLHLPSSS